MVTSNMILEAVDLSIGYGEKIVSRDINLMVTKGQMVCLLGQNGVGKSTLMKTLAGLIDSLSGAITIDGKDLQSLTRFNLAKKISIVTTEKVVAPGLSVMDILMAGRYPHQGLLGNIVPEDFKQIDRAIEQTRIAYLLDKKMHELSDGQRQKVMIARALVQNGDLILLDEPTAHLDMSNRLEVMNLLKEITSEQGKTLLISTHELSLATQFSDRLWLMDFGKPIIEGTPEDLALSGELSDIYHHSAFDFDIKTGRIIASKQSLGNVTIEASSDVSFWINSAIERNRIKFGEKVIIEGEMGKNSLKWTVSTKNNSYKGVSIDELIKHLITLQ